MIKSNKWIREFGLRGGITPFIEENVNPASYDVTLSNSWKVFQEYPPRNSIYGDPFVYQIDGSSSITLEPDQCVLAITNEVFKLDKDVIGFLTLKSSLARIFLNHMNSNLVNPGFEGKLILEFHNCSNKDVELHEGQRVSQIIFMGMEEAPDIQYKDKGKYQCQKTIK